MNADDNSVFPNHKNGTNQSIIASEQLRTSHQSKPRGNHRKFPRAFLAVCAALHILAFIQVLQALVYLVVTDHSLESLFHLVGRMYWQQSELPCLIF